MIMENYICEECGTVIEDVHAESGEKLPKFMKCKEEGCTGKCYRSWGGGIHIPTGFQALKNSGAEYAKNLMKHGRSPSGAKKRFY